MPSKRSYKSKNQRKSRLDWTAPLALEALDTDCEAFDVLKDVFCQKRVALFSRRTMA